MTTIGIMSFAHLHAHSYAACLNELPEAELAAVWDDNAARGKKAAKEFGSRFQGDLDKFFAGVDGVVVTSENMKHRALVEAAANAGKWILCEKPLAPAAADAKAMIAACKKAKVSLSVAFPCRFAPALVAAHDRIQAGQFGDIYAASCTNHGSFPGGWFAQDELSGGGATMDHTVHVVDVLRYILGKEFTSVFCELGNQFHKKTINTDDFGSVHMEMEGGTQISHLASWSRPKSFPTWGDVTIEFIGEKGVLNVDAFGQRVDLYNDEALKAQWVNWGANPDLNMIRNFVEGVAARKPPTRCATGIDGLRATEVTVAAYKSAKSKKMVKI